MISTQDLLTVIVALVVVVNLGTLLWIGMLQGKLRKRDQAVVAAQHDLGELKQEAHNVTLAKILLQMEQTIGADIEASFQQLTLGFREELRGSLIRITTQMEGDASQLLAQYRETLNANLQEVAAKALGPIHELVDQQRVGLIEDMQADIKRQQAQVMAKFDAKLSDVVSSYLTETLGNDVDLGAQSRYLFRMLDEHKDELKQEISGGA